ncbi:dynamin family protein [Massilia litorea]|uniref:Dynamin family protein n=1 Tax=Massilia litorea TaxID=2769491 RepID=A0A7L9U7I4_9BURK|nr:dynamin family protein [Massilia litorea]QOL50419.1 dynamin family protein [Massilia litorea]
MQDIQEYSAWRASIAAALNEYRAALGSVDVLDAATTQRMAQAAARVRDDRLSVAFVAEFSRGKSELINAIFFADYGQRILPSSAGRTTMCPTELLYDAAWEPCIRLLPIETRARQLSTSDFREDASAWTVLPLALDAPERMAQAFRQVSMTRRVPPEEAQRYGLYDPDDPELADALGGDGLVEISQWRHAIINLPHPLLKQGLVILDTPGLNAIGTEPELTLNLIPNAHAVLFVLAAETGVTRSDIEVWRTHIGAGPGRIVVLNKIDAMWDALRSDEQNEAEIARQQASVAQQLGLAPGQVYPVSAQKALVGRIQGDMDLFERSRLGELEAALLHGLIPQKKAILGSALREDLQALASAQTSALAARARGLVEQLQELKSLRGKNQNVLAHMMRRIEAERKDFDAGLLRLQDARARFTKLSTELYSILDMDAVARQAETVRMALHASRFATGMRAPVRAFFENVRASLDAADAQVSEIGKVMDMMVRGLAAEHGLTMSPPMPLSLALYRDEIDAVEALYVKQFGTATLLMSSRSTLLDRFFDSIVSNVRRSVRAANADVEAWLKVIMVPLETQIRQHKEQLRHRLSSIQRIHDATDSLEQKIAAFETSQEELDGQRRRLDALNDAVAAALDDAPLREAA